MPKPFAANPGFTANSLPQNDDSSTGAVPIGFTLNFFGLVGSTLFVNNNGNVTFSGALSTFTPFPIQSTNTAIIAPFFADVDTRNAASGVVQYGSDTVGGRPAFGVNWFSGGAGVGYFNSSADRLNTFQLVLIERSDTGSGNFDFEFNYSSIQWETGSASGGTNGLGGDSARAGYSNGSSQSFEIPGSAINGAFLNGGPNALASTSIGTATRGRSFFQVRNGAVQSGPPISSPLTASGVVGQNFTYQFQAPAATSVSVSNLPQGLTFDSSLRAITGNPAFAGTFQIGLSASNSSGTTNEILTLTVQPNDPSAPVVRSGTSATGRTGSPFTFQVYSSGATSTARLNVTGLPQGLSFDAITGLIFGTATADGSTAVNVVITDGLNSASATIQLTFSSDPALPIIISPNNASLAAGQPFSYTIVAPAVTGPNDPTVFRLIGTLPPGLGFNSATGVISGTLASARLSEDAKTSGPRLSGGVISNVQLFATNSSGTTTIPLILFLQPTGVANLSTRLAVGADPSVLIGGFIVTGNAPKRVILRAIAPSLSVEWRPCRRHPAGPHPRVGRTRTFGGKRRLARDPGAGNHRLHRPADKRPRICPRGHA